MIEAPLTDLADASEIERRFTRAYDDGDFRRAMLYQLLLIRSENYRVSKANAEKDQPEGGGVKARATLAQRMDMLSASDETSEVIQEIEAHLAANEVTNEQAALCIKFLRLGLARAKLTLAELEIPFAVEFQRLFSTSGGKQTRQGHEDLRQAYREIVAAQPTLTVKELAAELQSRFPGRSYDALVTTIYRWQREN